MKRYALLTLAMMAIFLALFGLAEWLGVPLLTDPGPWLSRGGWIAAALGFALLVADVLLPVPSSLVMIAHGALFGVVGGTLLSLAGSLGAGLFGFALGRRGGPLLDRLVPEDERLRANALLERWGDLAIVVTRPVPILAETLSILAGTSSMSWSRMTVATFAGSLPAALIYALAGATARSLDNVALVFGLVLGVTGIFWLIGKRLRTRSV
ncbi:MAG TPA: VTT domain-containing protein [Thermoanaerobaculia bacterium]|jgi:uncharacterized membrane protein YdjX (TVP38/TMEM64 family)|nr:VTT domain-containing protein [Thermoanaerobaculia bacterium]